MVYIDLYLRDSSGVYICKSVVNDLRHGNYICKSEGIHLLGRSLGHEYTQASWIFIRVHIS